MAILLGSLLCFSPFAQAKLHSYIDDEGKVWYVLSSNDIPAKYQNNGQSNSEKKPSNPKNLSGSTSKKSSGFSNRQIKEKKGNDLSPHNSQNGSLSTRLILKKTFLGIKIIGAPFFVTRVEQALNMLVERSPYEFKRIRSAVVVIRQAEAVMMWTELDPPEMALSAEAVTGTPIATVGIIAYEACLAMAFQETQLNDFDDYEAIEKKDLVCVQYEERIMKQIGASVKELEVLPHEELISNHGNETNPEW